jgi:DMSO/TMAO reductase YedYZ molybdopterin-dependent catalytic subunit
MARVKQAISTGSRATIAALAVHYLCFYLWGVPLWTDTIAQWIMARTPNQYALWILGNLGAWAKPFAMTGGLATLGFGVTLIAVAGRWSIAAAPALAMLYARIFDYPSAAGSLSFWGPAFLIQAWALFPRAEGLARRSEFPARREALVMIAGTVAVAFEALLRDVRTAANASAPIQLAPFAPPHDAFAPGLVRKNVTPVSEFYGMSKNTVDPAPDPRTWRLRLTLDGKVIRQVTYSDLLALPRHTYYSTMRCISNTLKSDLMGTAQWTGIRLEQLVARASLPPNVTEASVLGIDGHGDSLPLDYAYSSDVLFAAGMNGKTLDRTHGFPLRLVVPRYYGFKNVKWISEIAFMSRPYFGTWPKMGYTKQPVVHTGSHIDRTVRSGSNLRVGGVAFAGDRGIQAVQVRAGSGPWADATMEDPISPLTWRRWVVSLDAPGAVRVQARAMDGTGKWQADAERPLFPDGVEGPTIREAR